MSSKDLYKHWQETYQTHHQQPYRSSAAWLYELKLLSLLLKEHEEYSIFLAIDAALSQERLSIKQFHDRIFDFIPLQEHVKLLYLVNRYGSDQQKKLWEQYIILDAEWFPTATTISEKNTIINDLTVWGEGIEHLING